MGATSLASASALAQDGAAIFSQRCAVCHSIGEGRLAGPDLKDVTNRRSEEWLLKFTKSAQAMIDSGDADAKALFEEYKIAMPNQDMPDADIKAVYAHIAGKSSAPAEAAAEEPAERSVTTATADEIDAGRKLFTGQVRFSKGGAACISCHSINDPALKYGGGKFAADVSDSYAGMGEPGVKGIISGAPFPAMAAAYQTKPLTEDEVFRLTAFMKHVSENKPAQASPSNSKYLLVGGGVGFVVVLAGLNLVWSSRKKASTKEAILERQTKSI